MKKLYTLKVRGREKHWSFPVWADPKYLDEWRADGLIFEEVAPGARHGFPLKLYGLDVRGKYKEWEFLVWVDPKCVGAPRADGLRIDEVVNIIPQWWVDLGLPVDVWCAAQDFFSRVANRP